MKVRVQGVPTTHVLRFLQLSHIAMSLAGLGLLGWGAFVTADSAYAQWAAERQLSAASRAARDEVVVRRPPGRKPNSAAAGGSVLGRFSIPRLNLSYVVLEGTDDRTLDRSIGHLEGTSGIGETGNIGIAGHRNTHFRKLEWVRRGDEIVVATARAEYRYRVEWMRLFHPSDMEVLDPAHGPAITLVTCFPFEYVGAAPLRFIMRALPDEETRLRLQRHQAGSGG